MLDQNLQIRNATQCRVCGRHHSPHCTYYPKLLSLFMTAALLILTSLHALAKVEQPDHFVNLIGIACTTPNGAGYVDFTATSWASESPKGDNPDIGVQYQIETGDGKVSGYTDLMHGKFTAAGRYQFSSTLYMTGDVVRVTLVVTALGTWGDGRAGGQMTVAEFHPQECDGVTGEPVTGEPLSDQLWLPMVTR